MMVRIAIFILLITITGASAQRSNLPIRKTAETSKRSIRLDVPMTNSICKAFKEGTRDFSGKPGPNYWQLESDYTIKASLDPATGTITGSEKISMHNNSKDDLRTIVLRLDHNIFRPEAQRGASVPAEATDGMVLTSLKVAGQAVDLTARAPAGRGNTTTAKMTVYGLTQSVATVILVDPVKGGATAKLEMEWHTKLPGGPNGRGHRMTQRFDSRVFQPTQWYPRVGKYDDLRGWETSPYLGPSEFYNNFGKFDVYLTVPGGWIVSGTGVLQNPNEVLTETARQRLSTVLNSDDDVIMLTFAEQGQIDQARSRGPIDKLTEESYYHENCFFCRFFMWIEDVRRHSTTAACCRTTC